MSTIYSAQDKFIDRDLSLLVLLQLAHYIHCFTVLWKLGLKYSIVSTHKAANPEHGIQNMDANLQLVT